MIRVKADHLLELHHQLSAVEQRLELLKAQAARPEARQQLDEAMSVIKGYREQTAGALERLQAAGQQPTPDTDEQPVQVRPVPTPTPPPAHPTPTPGAPDTPVLQEVRAKIFGVEGVVTDGQVRLILGVQLANGQRHRVQLSPDTARLLKDGQPASLRQLRIGIEVLLGIEARTGTVRSVTILSPEQPSRQDSGAALAPASNARSAGNISDWPQPGTSTLQPSR